MKDILSHYIKHCMYAIMYSIMRTRRLIYNFFLHNMKKNFHLKE